jgi:hypothetical protein
VPWTNVAECAGPPVARVDTAYVSGLVTARPTSLYAGVTTGLSRCSYALAYITASSKVVGFCSTTYVRRGWPKPTVKSCTC